MSGLKLWEFADTLQALMDTLQGADDPAVIAEIEKAIETQFSNIAQKVDGLYEFLSRSESEAERLSGEIKRLQARKKIVESRAAGIEARVMDFMVFNELPEMKGDLHRLVRRLNPPAVWLEDEGQIPAKYITIEVNRSIDKAAIARDLKAKVVVPGAELHQGERIERK